MPLLLANAQRQVLSRRGPYIFAYSVDCGNIVRIIEFSYLMHTLSFML